MRRRLTLLLASALTAATAVVAVAAGPAGAQLVSGQAFSGYATGTAISLNALTIGPTTIAGLHAARSSNSVNAGGLGTPLIDEFGQNINPALPADNSYGRGTGIEVGLAVPAAQQSSLNTILLSGLAQAAAPPPTDLITREIGLDLQPVAFASLLRGQAQAVFDPNVCVLGQPLSYGLGYVSNLQLLGPVGSATVATNTPGNNASQSRSFTYLIPNPDGTFGLVSETRQIVAPISLLGGLLQIEVAGEFLLRATATGKPGDPRNGITFPGNPIVQVKSLGVPVGPPITLSGLLGPTGLNVNIPLVGSVSLGQAPRAIGGPPGSAPVQAADGTRAAGAIDAIGRVTLLPALGVLDLGLAHMEAAATVPAGGIRCTIPVAKTATPNPAAAGDTVTWTISIPADAAVFARLFACDLLNISATDTHSVQSGNPRFQLLSASHGGVVSGNTVTWANLGNYVRGSPPIILTVTGRILGGSGVIKDIVNVTATLGNCTGGAAGQAIAGQAQFQAFGVPGSVTLIGPDVGRGTLSATGGDARYLVLGGFLMLGALELRRRIRRRPIEATTSTS